MGASYIQGYLDSRLAGATVKGINIWDLQRAPVAIPPSVEQVEISQHLDREIGEIEAIIRREQKLIGLLRELRTSLISEVVTGKIDVRDAALSEINIAANEVAPSDVNPFEWWILSNYVLNRMASRPQFGRITLVKVLVVLQYEMRLRLTAKRYQGPHQRWDFGPFDPKMINALEASLEKKGYWRKIKTADARRYRYEPLAKANDPGGHFDRYWSHRQNEVDRVIDLFEQIISGERAAERAEIVATLYAAWNDLLIAEKEPTDEEIIWESRENWHKAKLKIEPEKWQRALAWMRERGLVPAGFGQPTEPLS